MAEAWYEVDGRPAAKGTPLCAKKKVPGETDPKRMYKKRVEGAGVSQRSKINSSLHLDSSRLLRVA